MLYVLEDQTHILGNLRSTRGHNQICTYVYMYSVPRKRENKYPQNPGTAAYAMTKWPDFLSLSQIPL
jgi:hypothetical protein